MRYGSPNFGKEEENQQNRQCRYPRGQSTRAVVVDAAPRLDIVAAQPAIAQALAQGSFWRLA